MLTLILGISTVALALLLLAAIEQSEFFRAAVMCFLTIAAGYSFYSRVIQPAPPPTPEQVIANEKRKTEIEEAKIPKVFSKTPDGCTVYKFVDNSYSHYFTRCIGHVSTDSTYRSGKSTKVETIQTHQEQVK